MVAVIHRSRIGMGAAALAPLLAGCPFATNDDYPIVGEGEFRPSSVDEDSHATEGAEEGDTNRVCTNCNDP